VRDFVYISDKAYSREDILGCEKKMLQVGRVMMMMMTLMIQARGAPARPRGAAWLLAAPQPCPTTCGRALDVAAATGIAARSCNAGSRRP
jgi:hypothetical protein